MKTQLKSSFTPVKKSSKLNKSMSSAGLNKENTTQHTSIRQDSIPFERSTTLNDGPSDTSMMNTSIKSQKITFASLMSNIGQLREVEQQCFEQLLLKEAHLAKTKAEELKKELPGKARKQLEVQFKKATDELMELQVVELNEFNQHWEQKLSDYEREVGELEADMMEKHRREKEMLKKELYEIVPVKVKMTKQHAINKKDLELMMKTREYLQADYLINLCKNHEKDEIIKAREDKERRVKFFMGQAEVRHRNEVNVLKKKINTCREEMIKMKANDLEKLLNKFQTMRQQLRTDQQLELSKLEVVSKAGAWESIAFNERIRTPSKSRKRTKSRDSTLANTLNLSVSYVTSPAQNVKDFFSPVRSPTASQAVTRAKSKEKLGHNRSFSSTKTSSMVSIPDIGSISTQPPQNKVNSCAKAMEKRWRV